MPFLEVSIKMLAECPLGSFAMLLLDASLKIANTQADLAAWGIGTERWKLHKRRKLDRRRQYIRRPEDQKTRRLGC